jgi:enoyl-CoA hydratase/carnithine racemase
MTRRLLLAGAGESHPFEAHLRESVAMWHASVGDGKEGVQAFLEKRPAKFTRTVRDTPDLNGLDGLVP